ncbi:TonB-dependent receptor [Pseudomonas cremoricolorata]|uniref:TonB-dependent receptor n=1 Tax=Pseudomonas cremoricolorata TaxID=157783 RepID=UPI00040D906F|nr:TonB-dependent siderophore receptor [Pseudomonas cremoricolorata]
MFNRSSPLRAIPLCHLPRTPLAHAVLLGLSLSATALPVVAADPHDTSAASESAAAKPAPTELDATQIDAQAPVPNALPPAYAGGHVAYGGRVGLLGNKDFMETPFSTVNYTDTYIADRQARDITEVIAATDPAVFSNGITGTYSENYSIRGFASNINDVSIGGLFGVAPYYRTSPEMYERIEVIKGPSALLNGMPPTGSVGGVINLVPKRAGAEPLTRLTGTYQSDAQFGGHLDVGRRFGSEQQFGVRFNSVYRDGDTRTDHQRVKAELNALALDWRGEQARLSLDLYQADDFIRGQNRGVSLAPGVAVPKPPKPGTLLNPDWGYVESKDKGGILRGEYDLSDQVTAYAAFGASETHYAYNGTLLANVINEQGDFLTRMGQLKMDLHKHSADVGLRGHFNTWGISHQWSVNATRYADKQKDYGRREVPGFDWITNIHHPVWGPEAPEQWPAVQHVENRLTSYGVADTLGLFDERLQLTLGVRRQEVRTDSFDTDDGARLSRYDESANTPAAAVLFKLTDEVSLYANYIEGLSKGGKAPFDAPNSDEIFPPYKSKQKEVGAKVDLGTFSHTLALYQIERPSAYSDPVTRVYSFGGKQRNRGVEWTFFGAPLDDVRLMGGVAYVSPKLVETDDEQEKSKYATGIPKLQGKLGAEWDTPWIDRLTLTANATSMSKQYLSSDNTQSIPGHTIYDLGARYALDIAGRPVTLRGTVNNVTNKAYWGTPLLASLALGEGRTVQLSASVDF